jgi:hypothetical protein
MSTVFIDDTSAVGAIFPYCSSGASPDPLLTAEPAAQGQADSGARSAPRPAAAQGDSVSFSDEARFLAASHNASRAPLGSWLNMPAENLALYNELRIERNKLSPGDPRIMELSRKMRALLTESEPVNPDDRRYAAHGDASLTRAETTAREAGAGPETSKIGRSGPYSDSGDAAFVPPYAAAASSSDAGPGPGQPQASPTPPLPYGYGVTGSTEHHNRLVMDASGRLHRIA